jgi:endonuclease YncB( thermonuclease family)
MKVRRQARFARVFFCVVTALLLLSSASLAGEVTAVRVTDGDTITVKGQGSELVIRLVGIDAPETSRKKYDPGQPFSQQAKKYLGALVLNKAITIHDYGKDKYGRTLAEVYVQGRNINLELVKAGLAEVYRGSPAPGQDLAPYWKAEGEARTAKKGMWSLGDKYVSPKVWRKGQYNSQSHRIDGSEIQMSLFTQDLRRRTGAGANTLDIR